MTGGPRFSKIARLEQMGRELDEHSAQIVAIGLEFTAKYMPDYQEDYWRELLQTIEFDIKKLRAGMNAWINNEIYANTKEGEADG